MSEILLMNILTYIGCGLALVGSIGVIYCYFKFEGGLL